MEIWKLLLITLLSAVLLGCIIGVLVGKHQLKVKSGNYKPLLSLKERIIYSVCIVLGAGCIAFGVYTAQPEDTGMEGDMMGGGMMMGEEGAQVMLDGDMAGNGEENPVTAGDGEAPDGEGADGEEAVDTDTGDAGADDAEGEDASGEGSEGASAGDDADHADTGDENANAADGASTGEDGEEDASSEEAGDGEEANVTVGGGGGGGGGGAVTATPRRGGGSFRATPGGGGTGSVVIIG